MPTGYDVFLSYSNRDQTVVRRLAAALAGRGIRVWPGDEELIAGRPGLEAIEEAIATVGAVAVLIGGSGLGPWEEPELRSVLEQWVRRKLPVIPVLLPDAPDIPQLPLFLRSYTWIDLRGGWDAEGLDRLVWGITGEKPVPRYRDEPTRVLSESLEAAYRKHEELVVQGRDTTTVTAEILALRRRLREGGQLKAGDSLADGRFSLGEPIGRGGFARVWKAYDRQGHRLVAVKVLHGQYAEDRTRRERFFRGAREMAGLQHPNVVRVVDPYCQDGGIHFFVMEYVGGGDLRQAVLAGRLSREERLRIILGVGDALHFAHERGVIHRDVKPSNILLDTEGRPKLTDFDLVRALDTTGGTRTGMLGTVIYAAPEVMEMAKEANFAADVYALGMTAVFALHGNDLPLDALRAAPVFIAGLDAPPAWREALTRAVAWEPEERWSSVEEFCRVLSTESGSPAAILSSARPEPRKPPPDELSSALVSLTQAVSWGSRWLERLDRDVLELTSCQRVDARRWLLRIRIPQQLRQLYGTAPEILVLIVPEELRGDDLKEAQKELYRREFDLDVDLLVVMDGEPGLPKRLSTLTRFSGQGQWVPWSPVNGEFPPFAGQLAAHLPVHDIFERQDPVRGRQVIGRARIVTDISRRLTSSQAVGVFGLRKIGKTTVVRAVTDRLDPVSARLSVSRIEPVDIGRGKSAALVAWVDCQRNLTRSLDSVAELLYDELKRRFDIEQLKLSDVAPEKDPLTRLDHLLAAALRFTSTPICVVLDEYDLLFEGGEGQPAVAGIEKLFGMFRAHAQETGRLALVVIGRDPDFFERPEMGGRTNPMLQWFIPRWLGPMTTDDAGELLRILGKRVALDVGGSTARLAYHWTGGHPLLHRQFGSALLRLSHEAEPPSFQIPTDPFHEKALDPFLERGAVMTICREVLFLLKKRYPDAVELLRELSLEPLDRAGDLFQGNGAWHLPATRLLKNFGLLSGTPQSPVVPELFCWYVRTFESSLPKAAAQ